MNSVSASPTSRTSRQSTPAAERKSFQGDHHRHRYMNNPHLQPPSNAKNYTPHYGSPTSPLQNNNKPPPDKPASNSPSPTPSPRSANSSSIVKKIGSALTAPFRTSNSRRGSDASDIRPPSDLLDLTQIVTAEHLPWMPSVGGARDENQLTDAQQIIRETRSREPVSPERVLRVVNGSPSLSTRASTSRQSDFQLSHTTQPLKINSSRHSFQSSTTTSKAGCTKCLALEHQLSVEGDRSRALERALDAQTLKLDQLRTWATAKVSSLDQTLRTQEQLLQQVEKQMAERHKPDIKSDYLIALQKDFVELNARLALLESKQAHHQHPEDQDPQPSISTLPDHPYSRDKNRAYSTPPLATTTNQRSDPSPQFASRLPWKAASPATMASKLRPPTASTPASPNSRSAPATPSSRSPRPRYTSALAAKAPSPLGFSHHHRLTSDQFSRLSPTPGLPDSPGSPAKHPSPLFARAPAPAPLPSPNAPCNYARPTLASAARHSPSPTLSPGHHRLTRPPPAPTPFRKTAAVGDLIRMFDQQPSR